MRPQSGSQAGGRRIWPHVCSNRLNLAYTRKFAFLFFFATFALKGAKLIGRAWSGTVQHFIVKWLDGPNGVTACRRQHEQIIPSVRGEILGNQDSWQLRTEHLHELLRSPQQQNCRHVNCGRLHAMRVASVNISTRHVKSTRCMVLKPVDVFLARIVDCTHIP